ncbi:hypothetical protein LTR15_002424 [Elasticomyces elasticus]|nr:hypothetical protein LTR15_002424 [Elasticomyces elasticus]
MNATGENTFFDPLASYDDHLDQEQYEGTNAGWGGTPEFQYNAPVVNAWSNAVPSFDGMPYFPHAPEQSMITGSPTRGAARDDSDHPYAGNTLIHNNASAFGLTGYTANDMMPLPVPRRFSICVGAPVVPAMATGTGDAYVSSLMPYQPVFNNIPLPPAPVLAAPLAMPQAFLVNPVLQFPLNNPVIPNTVTIPLYTPPPTITTIDGVVRAANQSPDLTGNCVDRTARLPLDLMSMPDILFGFPHASLSYPDVLLRARGNGWSPELIAASQLFPRGIIDAGAIHRRAANLRQQILAAGKAKYPNKPGWNTRLYPGDVPAVGVYDAGQYATRPHLINSMQDMTLEEVGRGWLNFQAPEARGNLTHAVLYARQVGNTTWKVSDVQWLAQQRGWTLHPDAYGNQWDQETRKSTIAILSNAGVDTSKM